MDVQLDVLHALFKYKYQMLSLKAADAETKTVESKPEVVEAKSVDELKKAMASSEPKVIKFNADSVAEGMRILENGTTREDGVKAFKCLRQAASQGHTEAQYQLSVCYDRGIGVRRNITEAAKWCQMAAFGGHAKAQSEIGYC